VKKMECGKVRDRFSSLFEKDLSPWEEKTLREHLANCSECQGDLKRFEKTMGWLRSMEEVKLPGEFLSGVREKIQERERRAFLKKIRLPLQAIAMLVIVVLVFYFTKIMPLRQDAAEKRAAPSAGKVAEEMRVTRDRTEAKKPLLEPNVPKDSRRAKPGPVEPGRLAASSALPAIQEITLRISDREKALSQIDEMIKQFGGEVVRTEENAIVANLPGSAFSEFEKELKGFSSAAETGRRLERREAPENTGPAALAKRKFPDREQATAPAGKQNSVTVRILLLFDF
jgi:hypothetical protein